MTDLSRRLAKLEEKAAPDAPALIVVFGDEPAPPNPRGAKIIRVCWRGVDDLAHDENAASVETDTTAGDRVQAT